MNDFLANKIIDQFTVGSLTAKEAWRNLQEVREVITSEKYDEISALIIEDLVAEEIVDSDEADDLVLESLFNTDNDSPLSQSYWDDDDYFYGEQTTINGYDDYE